MASVPATLFAEGDDFPDLTTWVFEGVVLTIALLILFASAWLWRKAEGERSWLRLEELPLAHVRRRLLARDWLRAICLALSLLLMLFVVLVVLGNLR